MQSRILHRLAIALAPAVALVGLSAAPAAAIAPTAFDGSLPVQKDQAAAVDLTGSVDDPDGGPRTFSIVTPPTHGDLSNACTTGLCSYTPDAGYVGQDSFTWRVSDGTDNSNVATVTITVADENGAAITSAGPLSKVQISPTLNCSVDRAGDEFPTFDQGYACGTLAVIDDVLYGPATLAAFDPGNTAFTPVAQSAVTGNGTLASPYRLVTTVSAGATGVQLVQTDTYVVGQESYRTDVQVKNSVNATTVRLYRAADCSLGLANASGSGSTAPTDSGAVACTQNSRIQQFLPITAGSHFYEAGYAAVRDRMGGRLAFPDTCVCAAGTPEDPWIDNAAGLQWDVVLTASQTKTVSSMFTHSATGVMPLRTAVGVDEETVAGGDNATYTVAVSNPGTSSATVTSVVATLPAGFTYQTGTTTGVTTLDPTLAGSVLTWNLPNPVVNSGASLPTLSFQAKAPSAAGTFTAEATATAQNRAVASSGPGAALVVTADNANPVANNDSLNATTGQQASVNVVANDTDGDDDPLTATLAGQATHGTASCAGQNCTYTSDPGYTGPDSFTYTVSDGNGGSDVGTVNVTVTAVQVNEAPIANADSATTQQGVAVSIPVRANDSDPNPGDVYVVNGKTNGSNGTVSCSVSACTYTPAVGFFGQDTFTYTLSDGQLTSDPATVTVTVTPVADLAVTATSSATSLPVGNLMWAKVTVRNDGGAQSSPSSLQTVLPAGFRVRNTTGCSTLASSGCTLPSLAPGASTSFFVYGALTRSGANGITFFLAGPPDQTQNNIATRVITANGTSCTRIGTFGHDRIPGTNGRDVFCGLTGNDVFDPRLGNDILYGNEGSDQVIYTSVARAVNINLGTRRATGQGTDVLSSIERAIGSTRNDIIVGNSAANVLNGSSGADVIRGAGGNDRLIGGPGNDRIYGGPGKDTCFQGPGRGSLTSC